MKMKIDLLYFKGCPNMGEARKNIKAALFQLSLPLTWNEVDVEDKNTPSYFKGFSSPTVLINGIDVETGKSHSEGTSSCKIGGVPSVSKIINAINPGLNKKGVIAFFATLPASVIAVFPSVFCPACYPALAALLSSLGLGFFSSEAILQPLTIIFLLIALLALFYQAYKLKKYGAFMLGIIGALGVYGGHALFPSRIVTYISAILLIGASIWNLVYKKKMSQKQEECSSCKT